MLFHCPKGVIKKKVKGLRCMWGWGERSKYMFPKPEFLNCRRLQKIAEALQHRLSYSALQVGWDRASFKYTYEQPYCLKYHYSGCSFRYYRYLKLLSKPTCKAL